MSILFFTKFSTQSFKRAKLKVRNIKDIVGIGVPSLVQMGGLSIIFFILNNTLKNISGTLGIVTFSYMSKVITYAIVPFTAITQALMPIVGYNFGAGNGQRVRKTISFCTLISFIYAVVALILFELVPSYMLMVFTNDISIIKTGAKGLQIVGLVLLFFPLPMIVGSALQAIGKKLLSLVLYASTLIFLAMSIGFAKTKLNLIGIWWTYVIANFLSTLLSLIILFTNKPASRLNFSH